MGNFFHTFSRICILIYLLGFATSSCSQEQTNNYQTIKGKVIHVSDGDTYDILAEGNKTYRIRMYGIDAPEKGQDFSRKATDYLKSLIHSQTVTLKFKETDMHGRFVALTYLSDGREVSHEMVRAGYAWHYKHYNTDVDLSELEEKARKEKIGLWADKHPVEPWFERALRRKGYKSVEIKHMKIEGKINSKEEVDQTPKKVQTEEEQTDTSNKRF